jgi:hypothetical protein
MSPRNNPIPAEDADWASPSHVHIAFLLLATLLGTYLCYLAALEIAKVSKPISS